MPILFQVWAMPAIWLSEKSYEMSAAEWSKIITAFFACAYRPALLGVPTEVFAFHFSFIKIVLIGVTSGFFGSAVSAFLSKELIMLYAFILRKIFPNQAKKKIMTPTNRLIIRFKHIFGIFGIALVSPVLLSIPFGTFLAIRFFGNKNRNRTVLLMTISTFLWTLLLYFLYHKFHHHFIGFFN